MLRHVRWSLIFLMTLALFVAWSAPYWLKLVISEEEIAAQNNEFPCPPTFTLEVCALLESLNAEKPAEADAMISALLAEPVQAPANEQDPASVESDIDKEAVSSFSNTLIRTGQFTVIDPLHYADGTANVLELVAEGQISRYLRFENDFEVGRGPSDLRVLLSINPEPRSVEELLANNTAVEIGILKGHLGGQNYRIPPDVDITQFRSVVIYSVQYERIFSSAPLQQPIR